MSRAALLSVLILFFGVGCSDTGDGSEGLEYHRVVERTPEADYHQRIQSILRPWDTYEKEWTDASDLVVVASYNSSSYPCIFSEDGGIEMIQRDTFTIEKVIKGQVARSDFDANLAVLPEAGFPRDFVSGRKYLVFMTPTEDSIRVLKDKEAFFSMITQIRSNELVAIIDVTKSKIEVDSETVVAHKTGRHKGFEFAPEKWRRLRESENIDLAAQSTFIPFLVDTVFPDEATIAHVRSYLGKPDSQHMNGDGTYYEYQLNTAAPTPHGTVSGQIELHFTSDTKLKGYYVKFYKYIEEPWETKGETWTYIQELDAKELNEFGLKAIDRYDP